MLVPYYRVEVHIYERSVRTGNKKYKGSRQFLVKELAELQPYFRQYRFINRDAPWKYDFTFRKLGVELRRPVENVGRPNNPESACAECDVLRLQSGRLCGYHKKRAMEL